MAEHISLSTVLTSPNFSLNDLAAACAATIDQSTLFDLISDSEAFLTLTALAISSGLDEELSSTGPWTLFAPSEAAFAALPDQVLACLVEDIPTLEFLLQYHVVDGIVLSEDLTDGMMITTIQGGDLEIEIGDSITVNGATIQAPDVQAINGVLHVIDTGKPSMPSTPIW